jgi:DNA polymerase-1
MFMLKGADGLDDILAKLKHGPLAVDTETTGLNWRMDRVGSINLAAGHTAIFAYKDALGPIAKYLSDQVKRDRRLVFHNAKFDLHFLRGTFGLHVPYPVDDTLIESHMLDNRGVGRWGHSNHYLKDLALVYVDPYSKEPQKELMAAIKERGGKTLGDWLLAPWKLYAKYSALDAWYTLQLHTQFIERIRHWAQPEGYPSLMSLYKTERWLLLALRDMETRGIRVNREYLEEWKEELSKKLEKKKRTLARMAGRVINWNSTPQLRKVLYDRKRSGGLGLTTDVLNLKKTEFSTDKIALLKMNHPIAAEILRYRKLYHAHNTDATALLNAMTDKDLVHCNFRQNVDTGRMACSDPNLQGQDRKSGVRKGFIPRDGLVLRFADYAAIEMRLAAHYSNEPSLVRGFNREDFFDPHTATAQQMYATKKPSDNKRKRSKDMNFASIYGAGEDKQTEMAINSMSVKEAMLSCLELGYKPKRSESPHRALIQLLRKRYREIFPTIPRAAKHEEEIAKERGFVMSAFGRHRYLDNEEAYKAFNSKIQGSAANAAKRGLVSVYRELQLGTGELALLLQVHDEIVYETEGHPRTDRRVLELLADTDNFRVPILAKMSGSRKNWQDKKELEL